MTTMMPSVMPTSGGRECFFEGDVRPYFNFTFDGQRSSYEGEFEVCIRGSYGSVCDIGWNQVAAQAVCRDRFGSFYGELCHF